MIWDDQNEIAIRNPKDIDKLNEIQIAAMQNEETCGNLKFGVAYKAKTNKQKQVYKIGFISEFLKRLYPEKNFNAICEIMSKRYDIFLSRRQIDRNVKRFLEDFN